jgi:hypothetical protein
MDIDKHEPQNDTLCELAFRGKLFLVQERGTIWDICNTCQKPRPDEVIDESRK